MNRLKWIALLSLLSKLFFAQTSVMIESPKWKQMIQNERANYYEVIAEFKEFWKYRQFPKEAIGGGEFEEFEEIEKEVKSFYQSLSNAEKETFVKNDLYKNYDFSSDVKSFKRWMLDALAWLKPNGTIYTLDERQQIIDRQRDELVKIESTNKK